MDGASLLRPRQYVLPDPVGICGVSSDHPWHRFAGDQGTRGRWVLGPTAIEGGRAKRQSATDEQGKKSACTRSVRSPGARRVDLLDVKKQTAMHHALHQVLTTLAASGAHRRFGVCQDCMYLNGETRCNLTSASSLAPECLLLGVPIEPEDVDLLCVHFRPTSEHNDRAHESTSAICGEDA